MTNRRQIVIVASEVEPTARRRDRPNCATWKVRAGYPQLTPHWPKCYHRAGCQALTSRATRCTAAGRSAHWRRMPLGTAEAQGWRPCARCMPLALDEYTRKSEAAMVSEMVSKIADVVDQIG